MKKMEMPVLSAPAVKTKAEHHKRLNYGVQNDIVLTCK